MALSEWNTSIEEAKAQVREAMGPYDTEDDYALLLGYLVKTGTLTIEQIEYSLDNALKGD